MYEGKRDLVEKEGEVERVCSNDERIIIDMGPAFHSDASEVSEGMNYRREDTNPEVR